MDSNLYIAGALTLVAGAVGFYIYQQMGCTNSVQPSTSEKKTTAADSKGKEKNTKSDAAKYPGGKVSIFFGSQTGTAEGFARTLMEEGKAAGFDAKSVDLEEFDPEVLSQTRTAIFLMATYGEGEPTDNAAKFFKWLKNDDRELENSFLSKVEFTVFGLGNRQYEHFNRMGKLTDKFLETLGGKRVFNYGEGDDDGTLEEDFDKWKASLWTSLRRHYGLDGGAAEVSNLAEASIHHPKPVNLQYTVKSLGHTLPSNRGSTKASTKIQNSTRHFFNPHTARLTAKRELRNTSYVTSSPVNDPVGSTLHLELDLQGTGLKYITADNLALIPENSPDLVNSLARALGYDLDEVVDLEPTIDNEDFKLTYPTPCTIRDLFTLYVDIQGKLQQSTLKHLIAYVQDPSQQAWLQKIASSEHRQEYHVEIEEERKSLVDLFTNELSSIQIPLADLLHITSPIQARDYTISSSSSLFPDSVHLTVGITESVSKKGKHFVGLTSNYFKSLVPNQSRCRVHIKESTFRLPKTLSSPLLLLGPGTGIAPMRALLQERQFLLSKDPETKLGKALLFFGCKHSKMDFIYEDELQQFKANGSLQELHTAFSRDTEKKVYVQHLLTEPATAQELLSLILEQDAYIYVCGATAMGNDIMNTIVKLIADFKKISVEEASAFVKKLQERKPNSQPRYVQELWS